MTEDLNRGAGEQIESDTLTAETVADVAGGAESATLVGQAAIPVNPPAAGQTVTLQPQPGDRYQLNANASDVRIQIEGVNVVLAFDTNGDGAPDSRVVFERLVEVAAQQNPPVLVVGGQAIASNVLIGGALALAGEEATVETAADAGAEGTGGSVYDDDLGNLIALLIAQGIIPPTELAFGLLDRIEIVQFDLNEAAPLEDPCDCDEKLLAYLETWRDGEFAGVLDPLSVLPPLSAFDKVEIGDATNEKLIGGFGPGFPIVSNDLLDGKGGNDLIRGLSGDDWLFGGKGDDLVYGDGLFGIALPSKDSLIALKSGGGPKEALFGGAEGFELKLGQILLHGDDIIFGGDGENVLIGGGGEDWLIGGGDDDLIVGDTFPSLPLIKDSDFGDPVEEKTLRQETFVNGSGGGTGGFLGGFFENYLNGKVAAMIAVDGMTDYNDILEGGGADGGEGGDWLVGDAFLAPGAFDGGEGGSGFNPGEIALLAIGGLVDGGEGFAPVNAYNDFLRVDKNDEDSENTLVGDAFLYGKENKSFNSIDLLAVSGGEGEVHAFNDIFCGGDGEDLIVGDAYLEGEGFINLTAAVKDTNFGGVESVEVEPFALSQTNSQSDKDSVVGAQVEAFNDYIQGAGGDDEMIGDAYLDGKGRIDLSVGIPKDTSIGALDGGEGGEAVFALNTISAFNDEMCPCGDTGNDLLVGDAYLEGKGAIDLSVGLPPLKDGPVGAPVLLAELEEIPVIEEPDLQILLVGNKISAFNDCLEGGPDTVPLGGGLFDFDTLVGDAYLEGKGEVNLSVGLPLLQEQKVALFDGGEGGEVDWLIAKNQVEAFNDQLFGGAEGDWLIGDVYARGKGGFLDVDLGVNLTAGKGDAVFGNKISAYNDLLDGGQDFFSDTLVGDVYSGGEGGYTDIDLKAELEAWGGGKVGNVDGGEGVSGNEVNVYNDSLDGGDGNDQLVGDVFFDSKYNNYGGGRVSLYASLSAYGCDSIVAGNLLDAYNDTLSGGDGRDRLVGDVWYIGDGGEGSDVEIDVSVTANDGGLVFDNEVTAHKDSLTGGAGDDLLVGDVYRDVDWGYGTVDLAVEVGIDAGNRSGESEVSHNTVSAFNDFLIGDGGDGGEGGESAEGGDDLLVGDVYYTSWNAGKGAPGAVHLSLDHGIDNFSWGKGKFQDDQIVEHNTVSAYNDKLIGGAGDDELVGDVFYEAKLGARGGVEIDLANGINNGSGGGEGNHEFRHNQTSAFNDELYGDGGPLDGDQDGGSDLLVGDVYYLLEGGKSAPPPPLLPLVQAADGQVDIDVLNGINVGNFDPNWSGNFADDNDHEHNTLEAFNDVMHGDSLDGGEGGGEALVLPGGDDTLIGDVYYRIDGGEGGALPTGTVDIDVHTGINVGAWDTGGSGNEFKDNSTTVFSDQIFGGGGKDLLVGDVYYQIEGGEGGGGAVDIEVLDGIDLENGSQGDSNEHQRNTLVAFNDEMQGGDGDDQLVGDVLYDTGRATIGSVHLLVETGAASGDSGVYGDAAGQEGNGNEVYAFNDSLGGGEGFDRLTGDVEAHGFTDDIVLDAQFVGGGSGNLLSAFNDLLYGGGGNDLMVGDVWHQGKGTTIDLFAGTIEEGRGSSTVEAYNDELYGGDGDDELVGDVQVTGVFGGTVDLLAEAAGASSHEVFAFNDKMLGGDGNDSLIGDVALGGGASANLSAESQDNTQGVDNKTLAAFNDHMAGGDGDDDLIGDVLVGAGDTVDLTARVLDHDKHRVRAFSDYLAGGIGADALIGDIYGLDVSGAQVSLLADMDSEDNQDDGNSIVAFNDTIVGDAGEDDLAGDVWMGGKDVSITLRGETGSDGDDNSVNAFSDTLDGGAENDRLVGDIRFDGSYSTIDLEVQHFDGHADDNTTGIFNDHIAGGDGDDTLVGDVWIEGEGGTGNSVAFLLDMVDNSNASGQIIDAYNDLLTGGKGNDVLVGDVWFEGDGSLDITFDIGSDAGDDGTLEAFNDTLQGNDGIDRLYGDFFDGDGNFLPNIVHTGGNASDGAVFSDTLDGGAGTDLLSGGIGDDTLTGGTESDIFIWFEDDLTVVNDLINGGGVNGGGDFSIDIITDFSSTIDADGSPAEAGVDDVIDLADLLAGFGFTAGDDVNDWLDIDTNGVDSTIQIDTDGNGAGFQDFIVLTGFDGTGVSVQDLIDNGNLQAV